MRKIIIAVAIVAFGTFAPSAFAADGKTTGLVGGAVAGAIVGGPVGAVIGGAAGYTIGSEVDRTGHRHKVIRRHVNRY